MVLLVDVGVGWMIFLLWVLVLVLLNKGVIGWMTLWVGLVVGWVVVSLDDGVVVEWMAKF